MKHTAWIRWAGETSVARFGAPFLLSGLRGEAAKCCDTVVGPDDPAPEAGGALLLLDAAMPLLTEEDMRALLDAAKAANGVVTVKGGGAFPRCVVNEGGPVQEISLGEGALFTVRGPETFAEALSLLRRRANEALMRSGVYLLDPERTYIDADVTVGAGTVIHPGCTISGDSVIGAECLLLPNSRIHASRVGDGTTVESSVLLECEIGRRTAVGPFAYLRPGTKVGDGCRVGDFVEIKNSTIGNGTKVSHLTYVGDSDLGERINLGCGVVFVNYDGRKKHRSTVGDDAFIGCNVNLVSPVHVGDSAYIAAGSTITEDVPEAALAIARERQTVKPGWVAERKTKGKL